MDDKEVAKYWDDNAADWVPAVRAGYDLTRELLNNPAFLSMLPDLSGKRVLDIGCREGYNTRILANLCGATITDDVRRWALREYLGLEDPRPVPLEVPAEELAQYAGHYQGYYKDMELGMLAGKLVGQITYKRSFPSEDVPTPPPPPPLSLALCEKDRLLVLDGQFKGATADAIRQPDGSIGWLRQSGRLHLRVA